MLTVAAVSAMRLVAARPWRPGSVSTDTDGAHLLMAIAMAGMLTPSLTTLPDTAWEVIFCLLAAWFAVRVALDTRAAGARALAGGHCAPHLVHSGAMLYMFLAMTMTDAGTGMAGMTGMTGGSGSMMTLRYPTVAFVFTLILVGYVVWDLDQLASRRYDPGAGRAPLAAPRAPLARVGAVGVPALTGAEPGAATALGVQSASVPAGMPSADFPAAARSADAPPSVRSAAAPPDPAHQAAAVDQPAVSGDGGSGGRDGFLLSPSVTIACRIAMGVVMAFMLVIAI
jgi:hypothetical protein